MSGDSKDDAWKEALAAIDRGEVTPEIERAVVEAARRVKRRQKVGRRHEANRIRDELRAQTGRVRAANGEVGRDEGEASDDIASGDEGASRGELPNHAHCYVCKRPYKELHAYYHALCVDCGNAHWAKREPRLKLDGRRAIVTGGRTKIGYRCALLLLRGGAKVTITTRYANDARRRYAEEADFASFEERLRIVAVDFRDIRAVHSFIDEELRRGEPLDILLNQAAQTIRSSPELERAERERDRQLLLPGGAGVPLPKSDALMRDRDHGELVDVSQRNTWDLKLEDVPLAEFFEVQLVNVFAPWALTARLAATLMKKSSFADRYVVQVSAIEGQFHGPPKTGKHPHTNMAKAALHMMVRTSAEPLAKDGIYMNAVDPGWVSDQSAVARRPMDRAPFTAPLDVIDGAARIVDPITRGLGGDYVFGRFLKDYVDAPW